MNKVIKALSLFLCLSVPVFSGAMKKKTKRLITGLKGALDTFDSGNPESLDEVLRVITDTVRDQCTVVVINDYDEFIEVSKEEALLGTATSKLDKTGEISKNILGEVKQIESGGIEKFSIYLNKIEKNLVKYIKFKRESAATYHYIPYKNLIGKEKYPTLIIIRVKSKNKEQSCGGNWLYKFGENSYHTVKRVAQDTYDRSTKWGYHHAKAGENYALIYSRTPDAEPMDKFLLDALKIIKMKKWLLERDNFLDTEKADENYGILEKFNKSYSEVIGVVRFDYLQKAIKRSIRKYSLEEEQERENVEILKKFTGLLNNSSNLTEEEVMGAEQLIKNLQKKLHEKSATHKEMAKYILDMACKCKHKTKENIFYENQKGRKFKNPCLNSFRSDVFNFKKKYGCLVGEVCFDLERYVDADEQDFDVDDFGFENKEIDIQAFEEDIKRIMEIKNELIQTEQPFSKPKIGEYNEFLDIFNKKYSSIIGIVEFVDIKQMICEKAASIEQEELEVKNMQVSMFNDEEEIKDVDLKAFLDKKKEEKEIEKEDGYNSDLEEGEREREREEEEDEDDNVLVGCSIQ